MLQDAVDTMPYDGGKKMLNVAAVVGWSFLEDSSVLFCCSLSGFQKSSNSLLGLFLRISFISVTLPPIFVNNASVPVLYFLDS